VTRLAALVFLATLAAGPACARTGNELLADCDSAGVYQQGLCIAFIQGASDGYDHGYMFRSYEVWVSTFQINDDAGKRTLNRTGLSELQQLPYCPPKGLTLGQMRDIVMKYLRDNPSTRHQRAEVLVNNAIIAAYPCAPK
jgi:hypothetical protein